MKSTGFTWRKFSRKLARNWGGRKRNVWINPHSACQAPCKALHGRTLVLRWDLQVELSIQCPHFPHTLRILDLLAGAPDPPNVKLETWPFFPEPHSVHVPLHSRPYIMCIWAQFPLEPKPHENRTTVSLSLYSYSLFSEFTQCFAH